MFPARRRLAFLACLTVLIATVTTAMAAAQIEDTMRDPQSQPLRIALPQFEGHGRCIAAGDVIGPGAAAYAQHIASRFERPVFLCLGGDHADAAKAIVSGDVEMAWLNQAAYTGLEEDARAIMTLRPLDNIARVPVVIFTVKSGDAPEAPSLAPIGYIDAPPRVLNRDRVFSVLTQWGASAESLSDARPYASFNALAAAMRAGEIGLAAVEIAAHYRSCRIFDPANDPCKDLHTLSTQRPAASEGFVVRRDMEQEWRHRLVGVHVGLHLEAPDAFRWISRGEGREFAPAEATALLRDGAEY